MQTCHSESGKIKTVYVRPANHAFRSDAIIERDWKNLGFLSKPDLSRAIEEYAAFEKQLRHVGAEVKYFPEDPSLSIDAIYCRDAAIATDAGMILCNMGKPARVGEPASEGSTFASSGIPILGKIEAPGTVEGGDVAWLDAHTLAVGLTYRTNQEGINQLTNLLKPLHINVITVHLPHYRGPADVFHLMSILSPVDEKKAVVYSPLMPINFRNELLTRGFQLIEVPEKEFDSMGCNVLALAPSVCLMTTGNPETRKALIAAGCEVLTYQGDEISVKGGGGPTCLTRPLQREV